AGQPAEATVRVAAPDLSGPRIEMERLLRRMVESGGSDLHLRTDAIPILRKDGELLRLEEPPIAGALLEPLLQSIMDTEHWQTFQRDNDVDWAWEVEGVARFRCNAGRERHGPLAVFRQIPAEIRTVEDLGLSREVQNLCSLNRG